MARQHTVLRSMHDTGLAAWFGGSLMGAVGLNGAAAQVDNPRKRLEVASTGWARWTPVNAAAIGAHLIGAAGILTTERRRVAAQAGVGRMSVAKTALTALALGVTAYSRRLGRAMEQASEVPVDGVTEPGATTPEHVAAVQRRQRVAQWAVPVVTGALLVVSSFAGEQQKPAPFLRGVGARFGLGTGRR